jgi:oleandomycin transport system permease protein
MNAEATTAIARPIPLTAATAEPRRRWRLARHSLVLARRGLINTIRTPEALIDVTLQPMIFLLMFTYIFGGAIAHGS